jgi:hypothetical protein
MQLENDGSGTHSLLLVANTPSKSGPFAIGLS